MQKAVLGKKSALLGGENAAQLEAGGTRAVGVMTKMATSRQFHLKSIDKMLWDSIRGPAHKQNDRLSDGSDAPGQALLARSWGAVTASK